MSEGGGGALLIVTDVACEIVLLPEASRATAVKTYVPSATEVVSQDVEYGAAVISLL